MSSRFSLTATKQLFRAHWVVALILVLYLALGFLYSQSTPILEGPDEMWHYPYVKHIADGKGLPQQAADGTKSEFHQPPLYYMLGALATFPLNTDDLDSLMVRNPYWGYRARAPEPDNKNIFVHSDRESWPYWEAVLAIHMVRWISVLLGAFTVLGAYLVAREIFPERRHLAAGTAALVAFTPQFLYLSGTVNNDNLITPLSTWALWLGLGLITGKDSGLRLVALGTLIGLALITKWTALALLPLAALALGYVAWVRGSWRTLWRQGLAVYVPALALSGWYFVRSQVLYGDPLGIGRKMEIFAPRSPKPTWMDLIAEIPRKELSYWASFGWENVYADPWVYPLLRAFVYIGVLGLVAFVVHRWRKRDLPAERWAQLGLLGAWSVLVMAAFVRWMIYTEAAVGRHLFPAMAGNMFLVLLGWTWFLSNRWASYVTGGLTVALFVLAAMAPFRYIQPTYAPPPRYAVEEMPSIPNPLDVNYGNRVRLLGCKLSDPAPRPGDTLRITFYWQVLDRIPDNYSTFIHVLAEDGSMVVQRDSYPGLGNYVTSRWQPGEIIEDTYPVILPQEAPSSARLKIMAGLYLLSTMERMPILNDARQEHDAAEIAQITIRSSITR